MEVKDLHSDLHSRIHHMHRIHWQCSLWWKKQYDQKHTHVRHTHMSGPSTLTHRVKVDTEQEQRTREISKEQRRREISKDRQNSGQAFKGMPLTPQGHAVVLPWVSH